jgi:hypothetical protein
MINFADAQQVPEELGWFQDIIRGSKSLLEIGNGTGGSLCAWASVMAPGSLLRSIDGAHLDIAHRLPGHDWQHLQHASGNDKSQSWAAKWAPYDVIFIDGGHNLVDVEQDWALYGEWARS